MRAEGQAVYEETVGSQLLADLVEYQLRPDRTRLA
jgi:hypothetical protein